MKMAARFKIRPFSTSSLILQLCAILIIIHPLQSSSSGDQPIGPIPTPQPWPEQFHALLYMNMTKTNLQITNLWYDWKRGFNVNIIQRQFGDLIYDVEWNNGTSFYFTLREKEGIGGEGSCRVMLFGVGIPRPDFLEGAEYLGVEATDGIVCNVWEKVDFIWYYEDVVTKRPVRWDFQGGKFPI